MSEVAAAESTSSSNNSGREMQLSDEIYQALVPCQTKDDDIVQVRVALLLQSRTFENMFKDLKMDESSKLSKDFVFPVKAIPTNVFNKVVQWLENHVGKPVPVVEEDPNTRERKWFEFTEYEKEFFKVDVEELAELLVAGNFLDLPSLYLYGCQSMAALIKDKSPEEIRTLLGLEDDLTEEEKAEIRRKNVWCNY